MSNKQVTGMGIEQRIELAQSLVMPLRDALWEHVIVQGGWSLRFAASESYPLMVYIKFKKPGKKGHWVDITVTQRGSVTITMPRGSVNLGRLGTAVTVEQVVDRFMSEAFD